MKRTLFRVLATLIVGVTVITTFASADPIKGGRILDRAIHDDCAQPSSRIALMHSVAEWEAIASSGQLEAEIAKLCDRKTPIKRFRPKYSKYVAEYLEHYANDSGAAPA